MGSRAVFAVVITQNVASSRLWLDILYIYVLLPLSSDLYEESLSRNFFRPSVSLCGKLFIQAWVEEFL